MIDFNTNKEVIKAVKSVNKQNISEYRNEICSHFKDVDSIQYISINLAKIFANIKSICMAEIKNKRKMPPKPEKPEQMEWYEYLQEERDMEDNLKNKWEDEIQEVETLMFSYIKENGLEDKITEIQTALVLYKMNCYNYGYCDFYAPEPRRYSGPGRFML